MKIEIEILFNPKVIKNEEFAHTIISFLEIKNEHAIFTAIHPTTNDSLLSFAIQEQAYTVVDKILEVYSPHIETKNEALFEFLFKARNEKGNNTFMTAVSAGHLQSVKWLCNFMRQYKNHAHLVEIISFRNGEGNAIFNLASDRQNLSLEYDLILEELVQITKILYSTGHNMESRKGKEKVTEKEIEKIFDIRAFIFSRNDHGLTPLIQAAKRNQLEMSQLLLNNIVPAGSNNNPTLEIDDDCRAIINQVDLNGNTALHYACLNECVSLASKLLFHGADERITNNQGLVAFDQASERHGEFLVLLSQHGALIGRCLNSSHVESLNAAATDQDILLLGTLFKPNPVSTVEIPSGLFDINDVKEFYFKNKMAAESHDIVQHCRSILNRTDLTPSQQKLIFTFYSTIQSSLQTLVKSKLLYDTSFSGRKTYEAVATSDLFVSLDSVDDSDLIEFIRRLDLGTSEIAYFLINNNIFCFNKIQDQCIFIPCTPEMIERLKSICNFDHLSSLNKDKHKGKEKEIECHSNGVDGGNTVTVNNAHISQINLKFKFNSNNDQVDNDIKFKFLKIPLLGKQIAFLKQYIHPSLKLEYKAEIPDVFFEFNLINPNLFFKKFDNSSRRSSDDSAITKNYEHIRKTQFREEITRLQKDIKDLINTMQDPGYTKYIYRFSNWNNRESALWIFISFLLAIYGALFCLSGYALSQRDLDWDITSWDPKANHTEAEINKKDHESHMDVLIILPLIFGGTGLTMTFLFAFFFILLQRFIKASSYEQAKLEIIFSQCHSLKEKLSQLVRSNNNLKLERLLSDLMGWGVIRDPNDPANCSCYDANTNLKNSTIWIIKKNLHKLFDRLETIKSEINIMSITTTELETQNDTYFPSSSVTEGSHYIPLVSVGDNDDYDLEANMIELEPLDSNDPSTSQLQF